MGRPTKNGKYLYEFRQFIVVIKKYVPLLPRRATGNTRFRNYAVTSSKYAGSLHNYAMPRRSDRIALQHVSHRRTMQEARDNSDEPYMHDKSDISVTIVRRRESLAR